MSKEILLNVVEPYRLFIINGKKTVEGRIHKGKFIDIKVGDIFIFDIEDLKFKIVKKNLYSSFREMLLAEGISNVIPNKNNIDDAVNVYYKFYTPEQEKEYGAVAFKLEKM